jgi:ABC-type transport system substrate-binding protein
MIKSSQPKRGLFLMKLKLTWLCLILMFMMSMIPSVSHADEAILRYPLTADPETLNPFTSETIIASTVLGNIYDGLVDYDFANNAVIPSLAERWEESLDEQGRSVYTFYLRSGVLFHAVEGLDTNPEARQVTADTILWNYLLALSGDEGISKRANTLAAILGAEAYTKGEADSVEGLKVLDPMTFQITLAEPDRLFLINGAGLAIASPAAYEQLGADFSNLPVGTGPFRFAEWKRDEYLLLEANPDYWLADLPKLDGIRFLNYADPVTALLAYQEDELDLLTTIPIGQRNSVMGQFEGEFNEMPSLHLRYFGFNMGNGFLAEQPLVRQAMNYALDRVTAWDIFAEGARFPANLGMLPPSMPASTPTTIYTYDIDKAAQLLVEAGFPNGEGIPTITLNVLSGLENEPHVLLWQQALEQLGITLELKIEDNATYWDTITNDDTMIFISGWAAGLNDPSDVFDYLITDPTSAIKYHNPEVEDLLKAARQEIDPTQREALYQQAHDLIMTDSVVVASAYGKVSWLQKPWVEGFTPASGGLQTARLEQVSLAQ